MRLRVFLAGLTAALSLALYAPLAVAQFNPVGDVCQKAPNSPVCLQNRKQNGSNTNPTIDIIRTAANIIALIGGIGAVIIILISGFMFVTAGGASPGQRAGDPNRIKSARSTLTGAIVGLVIIALAWTIVTFVTKRLVNT